MGIYNIIMLLLMPVTFICFYIILILIGCEEGIETCIVCALLSLVYSLFWAITIPLTILCLTLYYLFIFVNKKLPPMIIKFYGKHLRAEYIFIEKNIGDYKIDDYTINYIKDKKIIKEKYAGSAYNLPVNERIYLINKSK